MNEQERREKVINGLHKTIDAIHSFVPNQYWYDTETPCDDALALLKAQEPRMMSAAEVAACPDGKILWVEERQGVTWNLFPLEIETSSTHPDTGTDYLFFITYHDIRKFECSEYNQTWRCWTQRPTNEQREATPWD